MKQCITGCHVLHLINKVISPLQIEHQSHQPYELSSHITVYWYYNLSNTNMFNLVTDQRWLATVMMVIIDQISEYWEMEWRWKKWNDGCFRPLLCTFVQAKLGQADTRDNEEKLMTKLSPEWVRTSDPVIRSPARYSWTTAPAQWRWKRVPQFDPGYNYKCITQVTTINVSPRFTTINVSPRLQL